MTRHLFGCSGQSESGVRGLFLACLGQSESGTRASFLACSLTAGQGHVFVVERVCVLGQADRSELRVPGALSALFYRPLVRYSL